MVLFCLYVLSCSHSVAEEAEAAVQGDSGGQEAQAAQSPERSESGCCVFFFGSSELLTFHAPIIFL